jgi:chromosome segregation ATPase
MELQSEIASREEALRDLRNNWELKVKECEALVRQNNERCSNIASVAEQNSSIIDGLQSKIEHCVRENNGLQSKLLEKELDLEQLRLKVIATEGNDSRIDQISENFRSAMREVQEALRIETEKKKSFQVALIDKENEIIQNLSTLRNEHYEEIEVLRNKYESAMAKQKDEFTSRDQLLHSLQSEVLGKETEIAALSAKAIKIETSQSSVRTPERFEMFLLF